MLKCPIMEGKKDAVKKCGSISNINEKNTKKTHLNSSTLEIVLDIEI